MSSVANERAEIVIEDKLRQRTPANFKHSKNGCSGGTNCIVLHCTMFAVEKICSGLRHIFGDCLFFLTETSAPRNVQLVLKGRDSVLLTWEAPTTYCHIITNYKVKRPKG